MKKFEFVERENSYLGGKGDMMSDKSVNHYDGKMKAKYNNAIKNAKKRCKLTKCILCGGKSKIIASHTVPRYVLNNMSNYHFYKSSWNFELPKYEKHIFGINEAGIFRMLCNKCDTKLFNDYEACEENLKEELLIENIVVATTIKSMFKKYYDLLIAMRFMEELYGDAIYNEDLAKNWMYYYYLCTSIDKEIDRMWNSFDTNKVEMEIIYRKILPYSVGVAAQGALLYGRGLKKGNKIDVSENSTLPWLYLTVLPLKTETFILLVKHKNDHDYDDWVDNFNNMDDNKKLDVISDMIFTELDDYFVPKDIDTDDLKQLCFKENDTFESVAKRKVVIKNHLLPPQNKIIS